jgi:outer membrane immunogenic protein
MSSKFRSAFWMWVGFLIATAAFAQSNAPQPDGRVDVALTYAADYAGVTTGQYNFWMQGGSVELSARAYRGLGIVADVTGLHTASAGAGTPLNLVTTTFGPQYTWQTHGRGASGRCLSLFGHGLVGEAHGFDSLFPGASGTAKDALSLAVQVGGGVDLGLTRHLSLRVIQANWLRTQMPNATTNVQNNLLLGAGVVFHSR